MQFLVDGYNVLHASPWLTTDRADGWLGRARERMLRSLEQSMHRELQGRTTLVWDANDRFVEEAALANSIIKQVFARDFETADEQIFDLIGRHSHRKQLVVVSGDRAIMEFSQRRQCQVLSSEAWLARLEAGFYLLSSTRDADAEPSINLTASVAEKKESIDAWFDFFGLKHDVVGEEDASVGDSENQQSKRKVGHPTAESSAKARGIQKPSEEIARRPRRHDPSRAKRQLHDDDLKFDDH